MRTYQSPRLQVYGSLQSLTGRLGSSSEGDIFYGFKGELEDTGSRNTCEFDPLTGQYAPPCDSSGNLPG